MAEGIRLRVCRGYEVRNVFASRKSDILVTEKMDWLGFEFRGEVYLSLR